MYKLLEKVIVVLLLLTIVNVFVDVLLRYVFNNSSIAMQEMEWHLFSAMFLLGIAYTLRSDEHVRVDILYDNFNLKTKAWVNIIGMLVFILPISVLIVYDGIDFAYQAYLLGEKSSDPGGLWYRFIIKSIIPLSFILLILAAYEFAKKHYLSVYK